MNPTDEELLHSFYAGDSSAIVQLIERLRRVGLSAQVRSVFGSRTLSALAKALENESALGTSAEYRVPPNLIPADCTQITPEMLTLVSLESDQIERIVWSVPGGALNIQDIYPLAPLQSGILFHHLLNEQSDPYVLPMLLEAESRGHLDRSIDALQRPRSPPALATQRRRASAEP